MLEGKGDEGKLWRWKINFFLHHAREKEGGK